MSKTFAKSCVINENFGQQVPNLSVYYKNREDMSRSYQVNSAFQSPSNSTISVRNTVQSNSTAHLFDEEDEVRFTAIDNLCRKPLLSALNSSVNVIP